LQRGPYLGVYPLSPKPCRPAKSCCQQLPEAPCEEKTKFKRAVGDPAARAAMTPKPRGVLSHPSKAARKLARRALGPLSSRVVTANTLKRYNVALDWFFFWAEANHRVITPSAFELDGLVAEAIEAGWQEGEGRGLMGDILSALPHFFTGLRGRLPSGWRLWSAWGKLGQAGASAAGMAATSRTALCLLSGCLGLGLLRQRCVDVDGLCRAASNSRNLLALRQTAALQTRPQLCLHFAAKHKGKRSQGGSRGRND